MLEPYSEEEREYIRYLVKKYLPGLVSQNDKDGTTIMYESEEEKYDFPVE